MPKHVLLLHAMRQCCCAAMADRQYVPADEKYKMDLSGLKPFIKTVAIQYCNEHAPKPDAQDQA